MNALFDRVSPGRGLNWAGNINTHVPILMMMLPLTLKCYAKRISSAGTLTEAGTLMAGDQRCMHAVTESSWQRHTHFAAAVTDAPNLAPFVPIRTEWSGLPGPTQR
ncbi:hypothetical protein BaRGS_00024660 [Batillaria attramentaria]|uniref:Uncharacterized protein n=1 Tax=Batillaria attramentaria TaxID=370345 RepID=A0ABD0KAC7_9CAEN